MAVMKPVQTVEISESGLAFLRSRGISSDTAMKAGVKELSWYIAKAQAEVACLGFPYRNDKNVIYAAKFRAISVKGFSCNGAPQTLFNANNIKSWDEVIITEGELDALSAIEAGLPNTVSVPGGALNKPLADGETPKMKFLLHHEKQLSTAKKIILATDADEPGSILADELARRIGRDRCWRVSYPDGCKDMNDVLVQHGKDAVKKVIADAEPWPIEGLYDAEHFSDQLEDIWTKGLARGHSTGLTAVDNIYSVTPGQLTVVTGLPGNGKSEFVDQLMVSIAQQSGWNFAVCSFENAPQLHIAKLISKYIGKPFFVRGQGRMTDQEKQSGLQFVRTHFSFLHSNDGNLCTLDSILERLRVAVYRHGISGAVIDPYNYIQKSADQSETDWVSYMLSRIRSFAQAHDVHIWFVAHPQKMLRRSDGSQPVPGGNDISGSAAWWAKADMGVTVHRPNPDFSNASEVHVWKVRFSWTGKTGKATVFYNDFQNRFVDDEL